LRKIKLKSAKFILKAKELLVKAKQKVELR